MFLGPVDRGAHTFFSGERAFVGALAVAFL